MPRAALPRPLVSTHFDNGALTLQKSTTKMQLGPRRDVWEFGLLPLHTLCPQLDSVATLQRMHVQLLGLSSPTPTGQRVISADEVASVLDLTTTQQDVLCEVLSALSILNGSGTNAAMPGTEQCFVHELSLFLFALLFSKEAQRPDNQEVWPEAGPSASSSFSTDALLSPTRGMVGKSPSGV